MNDSGRQVQGVIVHIFGEEYRIVSDGDPAEVQRVAEYVDRKMQELANKHGSRLPKPKLAVLAAMDIAAELLNLLQERQLITEKAHEKIDRLTRLIDERASLFADRAEPSPLERLFRAQPAKKQDSPATQ